MSVRGSARRLRRRWRERQTFASTALRSARRRRRPRSSSSQLISVCAESEGPPPARYAHSTDDSDAPDDRARPSRMSSRSSTSPCTPSPRKAPPRPRTGAPTRELQTPRRSTVFARERSVSRPSRRPDRRLVASPSSPSTARSFNSPVGPIHSMSSRSSANQTSAVRARRDPNPHFAIAVDEEGHAYVSRVDDERFEAVCRFPGRVDETTAEAVYKEGVLFVIARPRKTHAVLVPVETPG